MDDIPEAEAPVRVDLDRTRALTVEWRDGLAGTFGLDDLRRNCPCAQCRDRRDRGEPVGPPTDPAEATDAALVGGWGLQITWSDGHSTGIYAWGILRAWAEG